VRPDLCAIYSAERLPELCAIYSAERLPDLCGMYSAERLPELCAIYSAERLPEPHNVSVFPPTSRLYFPFNFQIILRLDLFL
jgi:hypothetical protein